MSDSVNEAIASTARWQPSLLRNELRERFRQVWQDQHRPQIEQFLEGIPAEEKRALFWDLLSVELELRLAAGERPSAPEYERRFSEYRGEIKDLLDKHALVLPVKIGRYQVIRRLGGGGFGDVFLCFDDRAQRQVAIKVPRFDRLNSVEAQEAFLREARNVARLDHPHIVPLYDFGEVEGQCFLVYKFVDGRDLNARMKEGPLSHAQIAGIVAQAADALHHAHGKNLFHRDIKPGNILLDKENKAFVIDFGLALPEDELLGARGQRSGTGPYMAPEQVRGEAHRIDGRTDIYGLGIVLYQLLVGRPAFPGKATELFDQILYQDIRPPRQIHDSIPRELERICLKAAAKQMSARYATASDMAEDLRRFMASLAAEAGGEHWTAPEAGMPCADTGKPPSSTRHRPPVVPKGLRSFGAEDRDFFLELLPGPRDRDGLPESLSFWKNQIESRAPDQPFAVGLVYGPSGCGKSSLVKAGLLPCLAGSIIPVYVEAASQDTEARLAKALERACPNLPPGLPLPEIFARLRRGRDLPEGNKLLLILDQFEQWLHPHGHDMATSQLVAALRHADGVHIQVLLLVRDDFWMGTSRLFELLEINLDRDRNTRVVDLFDLQHGRRVLRMFGQAFERLPASQRELSEDENTFLNRAVTQLSEDGRIIPVRLSLFADLMKDRPWTTPSLSEVGGAEGVGLRFLEETFAARTAVPDLRALEKPVRALLQALLPEQGTDIKGRLRSRQELAQAAGLPEDSSRFARLLDILDRQLHILTPTESAQAAAADQSEGQAALYQLTHDYLVPPLRQWLTRERRKTWRGRAQLCLEERTSQWIRAKDRRFLPSFLEYLHIACGVPPSSQSPEQRALLHASARYYGARSAIALLLILAVVVSGIILQEQFHAGHARDLTTRLFEAETRQVPTVIAEMEDYRHFVNPMLAQALQDSSLSAKQRLHAALALCADDPTQADYLKQRLLDADPDALEIIHQALKPHANELSPGLWNELLNPEGEGGRRLRAACALAAFDPQDSRWKPVARDVVARLSRSAEIPMLRRARSAAAISQSGRHDRT